jgi:hypothetical protein
MNFYDSAFLALISACGILTWRQYRMKGDLAEDKKNADVATPLAKAEASRFIKLFLTVYCLVMASDWLQGITLPHFTVTLANLSQRSIRIQPLP